MFYACFIFIFVFVALSKGFNVFKNNIDNKKKLLDLLTDTTFISRFAPGNPLYLQAVICKYTTNTTDFTNITSNRRLILDIITDAFFLTPGIVHAGDYVQRRIKTYVYFVTYGLPMPDYFQVPKLLNAYHETEKFMAFGFALKHKDRDCSVGSRLSREVIKMWSNFAKTG